MDFATQPFPHSLCYDFDRDSIVVSCGQGCSVQEFNRITGALKQTVFLGPYPSNNTLGVCAAFGSWWLADIVANRVWRVDPVSGTKIAIPCGAAPRDVCAAGSVIVVTESGANTISKIDPGSNAIIPGSAVPTGPGSLAYRLRYDQVSGRLCATLFNGNAVLIIDVPTWTVVARVPVGAQPWACCFMPGKILSANYGANSISGIDATTLTVTSTWGVDAGAALHDLTYIPETNEVMAICSGLNQIQRLDPLSGATLGRVSTGTDPAVLTLARGVVWQTNALSNTIRSHRQIALWQ